MEKERVIRAVVYLLTAIGTALAIAFGVTSCVATRTITTQSEFQQRGDTSVTIQTKTIESYTGTKK